MIPFTMRHENGLFPSITVINMLSRIKDGLVIVVYYDSKGKPQTNTISGIRDKGYVFEAFVGVTK